MRFGLEVVDGGGNGRLEEVVLRRRVDGDVARVPASGLFILIGANPHSAWLLDAVVRDDWGFVVTGDDGGDAGEAGA